MKIMIVMMLKIKMMTLMTIGIMMNIFLYCKTVLLCFI